MTINRGFNKGKGTTYKQQGNKPPGGARGKAGRPPKPKDPSLLERIYAEIDSLIKTDCFPILKAQLRAGKRKGADRWEKELAARIALDLLDKRLPKQHDMPPGGITINIKSYVPGLESGRIEV